MKNLLNATGPLHSGFAPALTHALSWLRLQLAVSSLRRHQRPKDSASGLADVDHPGDAVAVGRHAELVAPHLLLQGHCHRSAIGQFLPVTAQVLVVPAEADADGAV